MSEQLSMLPPIAHRDDPASSHEAARHVRDSGRQSARAEFAAWLVGEWPGSTAYELQAAAGLRDSRLWHIYEIRRALSDAARLHLIARARVRRCDVPHGGCRGCGTWSPTQTTREET